MNGLLSILECRDNIKPLEEKLKFGYKDIKIKIGILDFEEEYKILKKIRERFDKNYLKISLDVNGKFENEKAVKKIEALSKLDISTIEQPIEPNNYSNINHILENTDIEIALDEELIFCNKKEDIFDNIKPCKIIIKPTLLGGFDNCNQWIQLADKKKWNWAITSSLEGNIGLSQIAQWAYKVAKDKVHGLSTINIYQNDSNNLLNIKNGKIYFNNKSNILI